MGKPEGKRRFVRPNFRWQNKKWTLNVMLCIGQWNLFYLKKRRNSRLTEERLASEASIGLEQSVQQPTAGVRHSITFIRGVVMVGSFCFLPRGCGCESCLFPLSLPIYTLSRLGSPVHTQNSLSLSLSLTLSLAHIPANKPRSIVR